ncbi:hypothetical protein FLGE108171_06800 [Flavobacterium gelidilacus]|uniref:hypothetical protein n=1 Tax=Flavobacterium gelidilacus TaxID=206041 RepID=UPI000688AD14|nr:hypothetical protein [Flavobacterium gelidilacus]
MLFTYNYIPHHIEKLQEYLDFLFFEVWCKADGDFNVDKLENHGELQQIYIDLGNLEGAWASFFNGSIETIYKEFLKLDSVYITELINNYEINNNIENLCYNKDLLPLTYDDIKENNPNLAKALKDFYSKIYGSNSPFNLEVFGFLNKVLITDYDTQFMTANNKEICPFCGINHLKGNNHSYREAYDHFIPKGTYPFNTLNFKNLTPMCNECNSTYKLTKVPIFKKNPKKIDPIKNKDNRSLAFYPYAENHPVIEFSVKINTSNILQLKTDEIELSIDSKGYEEQIESWIRVFGLDERYKALLCSPSAGKDWFNSIMDEYQNAEALSDINGAEQYYNVILKDARKNIISGQGFIKSVFLEECKSKGLFEKKYND